MALLITAIHLSNLSNMWVDSDTLSAQELFLLALTSVADDAGVVGRHHVVLSALRGGPRGLGSLSMRLALKNQLESGGSLQPLLSSSTSVPALGTRPTSVPIPIGALLWLLRVFIGRLPSPLLNGARWRQLARQCSVASRRACASATFGSTSSVHLTNIAAKCVERSSPAERTLLKALLQMLSKLSGGGPALPALADFYAPCLIGATSVRPGDETQQCMQSLLLFLSYHWREIFELTGEVEIDEPLLYERDEGDCCKDVLGRLGQIILPETRSSSIRSLPIRPLPSLSSRKELAGERTNSWLGCERKAISSTDTRDKQPLMRRFFKHIYDAGDKSSNIVTPSIASTEEGNVESGAGNAFPSPTGRTPPDQTPLLRISDPSTEIDEDSPTRTPVPLPTRAVQNGPVEAGAASRRTSSANLPAPLHKEKARSHSWLKSLFVNRGASTSSIPPAICVKYEQMSRRKKNSTL